MIVFQIDDKIVFNANTILWCEKNMLFYVWRNYINMFFYIAHQFNQYIMPYGSNGERNVRTLIYGGILYILTHALLTSQNFPLNMVIYYYPYFILLDVCVMAVIYKLYYGRLILHELDPIEQHEYNEKEHKYRKKKSDPELDADPPTKKNDEHHNGDEHNDNNNSNNVEEIVKVDDIINKHVDKIDNVENEVVEIENSNMVTDVNN